jgi:hypothetical protein
MSGLGSYMLIKVIITHMIVETKPGNRKYTFDSS